MVVVVVMVVVVEEEEEEEEEAGDPERGRFVLLGVVVLGMERDSRGDAVSTLKVEDKDDDEDDDDDDEDAGNDDVDDARARRLEFGSSSLIVGVGTS